MTDNIKFRELRGRIDKLLSQLSGLTPPTAERMNLLENLFKEFRHELNNEEESKVLKLFHNALKKENMLQNIVGPSYNQTIEYHISPIFMNEIEKELRNLLGIYGFYQITKEEVDYQLGEF